MTQKQKGFVGLGVMVALSAGLIFGEEPLYQGVRRLMQGNVSYTDGTYVGTAKGFGGEVIAQVTVTSSGIAAVELTGPGETPDYGGAALKVLSQAFVESGSSLVDTVSGATITSQAAMSAVQQALDQAAGKIEVIDPDTVLAEKETEEQAQEIGDYFYDGGLRTGLAVLNQASGSTSAGEKDGNAQVESMMAAVVIDGQGRIVSCKLDSVQSNMAFTKEGKVVMQDSFATKKELGDDYGMKVASSIGKDWYEQAEAFEQYALGKTAKEIAGIAVNESGKAADADLSAGVTLYLGNFQNVVIKAIQNAQEVGTQEGDRLGLAAVTDMHKSKDAAADAEGQCQAYSTYMAVTVNEEGVITGCVIDASQGTVKFDASGTITSDLTGEIKTKRELGDAYGMKNASSIGKEWYEQANAMEDYITGKTLDQVMGIAVTEGGVPTDADLSAGVTVAIGDFQKAAEKAVADAEETEAMAGSHTYEGGLRTGFATVHWLNNSKDAGESDGTAQVDTTVAAVVIDGEGRVVECKLDTLQSAMAFTKEGKVVMQDSFATKKELGDSYGMKAASGIGKEWYEQAEAFEQYVIGKTAGEILGIAVNESGKPAEEDLAAGVTVGIGDYQQVVAAAIGNAAEIGTQEGDQLGIGIVSDMHKSKDAAADAEGQCQAYTTYAVVTTAADGTITGCILDASQGTVKFDTAGVITSDLDQPVKTKRELGDGYGMKAASTIGKEWYEQADAMEDYITGKTLDQVMGIAVTEGGVPADADLSAGVTVAIGDFQQAVEKAAKDAQ